MLWALVSSAYVIYLYRKLNAADEPTAPSAGGATSALEMQFAELDEKISLMENRLRGRTPQ